jgi:Ca2+-dependent lipid-binding protein
LHADVHTCGVADANFHCSICRHVGLLIVTVLEAKGLKKADAIGKSDPFVELWTQATNISKTVRLLHAVMLKGQCCVDSSEFT